MRHLTLTILLFTTPLSMLFWTGMPPKSKPKQKKVEVNAVVDLISSTCEGYLLLEDPNSNDAIMLKGLYPVANEFREGALQNYDLYISYNTDYQYIQVEVFACDNVFSCRYDTNAKVGGGKIRGLRTRNNGWNEEVIRVKFTNNFQGKCVIRVTAEDIHGKRTRYKGKYLISA